MRIAVLTFNQPQDSQPEHFISKSLSRKFLAHSHNGKKACQQISERLIQIVIDVDFGKLKMLLRTVEPGFTRDYPEYLTPKRRAWNQGLLIHYPLEDQRSFA